MPHVLHVPLWCALCQVSVDPAIVRVGFSEQQYQAREDVGRMMVPVQLDGGDSQVSLCVFTVDGTAYGNYGCYSIFRPM